RPRNPGIADGTLTLEPHGVIDTPSTGRWARLDMRARPCARGRNERLYQVGAEPALADVVDGAGLAHLERTLLVLPTGHRDDRHPGVPAQDLACRLDAVHHR